MGHTDRQKGSRAPCQAGALQIAPQIGRRFLGLAVELERRDEAALLVHQIDQRGVIHAVVAIVGGNFLGVDPVGFLDRVDRLGVAGERRADADRSSTDNPSSPPACRAPDRR